MREKDILNMQKLSYNPNLVYAYYEDYVGAVQIFQLDENDNRIWSRTIETFPKTIEQTLDIVQQERYINYRNFSYRWWKSLADEATYLNH